MKCFRARWNEKSQRMTVISAFWSECSDIINYSCISHLNQGHMREVLNKEDKLCEVHICGPSGSRLLRDEAKKNFPW